MEGALAEIDRLPSASKTGAFQRLLEQTYAARIKLAPREFAASLRQFLAAVLDDSVGLVVSKQVVATYVQRLRQDVDVDVGADADAGTIELKKSLAEHALEAVGARQASFEEQATALRELLADLLEQEEEWTDAARMLQGIPLDASNRSVSDEYKLKTYVRIVRLLLEDGDTVAAQSYLSRAQNLIRNTNDQETILGFKLSQARIYDSQRKFQEAASKYHEISYVPEIDEGERLQMLSAAVTCAILSAAGPRRSRLLASLYRDERSAQLPQYNILVAMFLDRIIKPHEVAEFSGMLQEHQKAKLGPSSLIIADDDEGPEEEEEVEEDEQEDGAAARFNNDEDGMTGVIKGGSSTAAAAATQSRSSSKYSRKRGPEDVLDKAVMEHNLLSASLIYSNITFSGLGRLLSLKKAAAEAMARTMIIQGRLKGASIDQVAELITFENRADGEDKKNETASSNVAAAAAAAALASSEDTSTSENDVPVSVLAPETARWDARIRRTAQLTEELAARCNTMMSSGGGQKTLLASSA